MIFKLLFVSSISIFFQFYSFLFSCLFSFFFPSPSCSCLFLLFLFFQFYSFLFSCLFSFFLLLLHPSPSCSFVFFSFFSFPVSFMLIRFLLLLLPCLLHFFLLFLSIALLPSPPRPLGFSPERNHWLNTLSPPISSILSSSSLQSFPLPSLFHCLSSFLLLAA